MSTHLFDEAIALTPMSSATAILQAAPLFVVLGARIFLREKVDGKTWTNNSQDIGFDWVEVGFEKPVHATEVRFVLPDGRAAAAVSKVELIEPNGTAHVIWSGVSDTQTDKRGPRTWFVRQFDATPYQVSAVKLTIANNLESNYKELDAVQIVGN